MEWLNRNTSLLISHLRNGNRICLAIFLVQLLILSVCPVWGSGEKPSAEQGLQLPDQEWTGDFDGMAKRRLIRALVTFSKTKAGHPINITNIEKMESNIHGGVEYLRWIYKNYFENEKMDRQNKLFFTLASYNAGPARVKQLRKEASKMGLDPNIWFRNVEVVAAKRIGRETVQYVSNIYKYYVAYRIITDQRTKKGIKTKAISNSR